MATIEDAERYERANLRRTVEALGAKAGTLLQGPEMNPYKGRDDELAHLWEQARKTALFNAADKRWPKRPEGGS